MYKFRVTENNGERHINLSGIESFMKSLEEQFEENPAELYTGKEIAKFLRSNRRYLISNASTIGLTKNLL